MTRKSTIGSDRRKRQRFSVNAPVTLTISANEIAGYTRDLSSQGMYFYVTLAEGLAIGQNLDLLVTLPPEITFSSCCSIRCRARLVRMEDTPSGMTGIAVDILQYSFLSEAETSV